MKLVLFLIAGSLFAQGPSQPPTCWQMNCYTASTGAVSLSNAGTAATIQQPASPGPYQQVYGVKAAVYCSMACTITRTTGGAAATTTLAQSSIVQSPYQPAGAITPLVNFYTASNASGGTTIDVTSYAGGVPILFDLSDVVFGTIPKQTYTISVGAITGTAIITYYLAIK